MFGTEDANFRADIGQEPGRDSLFVGGVDADRLPRIDDFAGIFVEFEFRVFKIAVALEGKFHFGGPDGVGAREIADEIDADANVRGALPPDNSRR